MKKRLCIMFGMIICCFIGCISYGSSAKAGELTEQKKEYVNVLSQLIKDGVESQKMDLYAGISKGSAGQNALKQAAVQNRAALMAEGIDFLDGSWANYYAVGISGNRTVFNSTKTISRKTYRRRYQKIMQALGEVLSCVEPGMTDADKTMAVYYYLAKNTVYENTADCHTGYDVLVNHAGVCDGFANAYALAMNTLGIQCAVVSNYTRDHSWNIVLIDGTWYFCDLTNGIGIGDHEGMVINYASCLVGVRSFLSSHPGYTMQDIYGEDNSDGLNIRQLTLAQEDYIPVRSAMRVGISQRTCLFYQKGYWYWISTGNMLKKSKLDGSDEQTVYMPADDKHIGWAEEFNETIFISLNDTIYRMDYKGNLKEQVRQVQSTEYEHDVSSYFWQIAYVGRFYRDSDDTIGYYVTDLTGAKRGAGKISVSYMGRQYGKPKLSDRKIKIRAGYQKQLYVIRTTPAAIRQIRWRSSNSSVAEVDAHGGITAKKKGTAVITAVIGEKRLKCTVKVNGYTITYKKAGINSAENVATASGKKKIVLEEPVKKGSVFEGWYTDKSYKNKITVIKKGNSKNYTLYAKWKKEQ